MKLTLLLATVLSMLLAACNEQGEKHQKFTVTFVKKNGENLVQFAAFVHDDYASDWDVYKRATYELCAGYDECGVSWFAGKAPKSEEDYKANEDSFLSIGETSMKANELSTSLINCDYINAVETSYRDTTKASVICISNSEEHEREMERLEREIEQKKKELEQRDKN